MPATDDPAPPPAQADLDWLVERSMLKAARTIARRYAGGGRLWQVPYGRADPRAACALASTWFTAYPAAVVTRPETSVLATLADNTLWQHLSSIGIKGIHIGPTKISGGLDGQAYTPTIDGNFDRISMEIDPVFGSEAEFLALSRVAAAHNAVVIDDVIPSHTGKGPDFRLAEMGYEDYPGLYHMVEIREEDWGLLPPVPPGKDAENLSPAAVDLLKERGYIVGQLQRVIFFEPGVKHTDWSATPPVTGADGKARRWVYLHYFKGGQPSLNWIDPSMGGPRVIMADALHAIDTLGARILRLDANGFLGIERRANGPAWSESHPLAVTGNQLLGSLIRKAGGFSFQELNLTIDDIALMSGGGADLSYDFITRPAYIHAVLTHDTEFLRLMLRLSLQFGVDPASLIHALQNHDEFTLELVHFWTLHANDPFDFEGRSWAGALLREHIRTTVYDLASGEKAPYNLKFVTNGIAGTTASFIAAALGLRDLARLTPADVAAITQVHLLLAMYNAFQPGVFALSGWDLAGALPLAPGAVEALTREGDTRWIARGGYDLTGACPGASASAMGMPLATSLYGSLPDQLGQPDSFASRLKKLLEVRTAYAISEARQIAIPDVANPSVLVMVHELPSGRGKQLTVLNFGAAEVTETVTVPGVQSGTVVDMIAESVLGDLEESCFNLTLPPFAGLSVRVIEGTHGPSGI